MLFSFGNLDKKKKKGTEKPTHELHRQDKNKKKAGDQGASASKKATWAADVKELLDEEEEEIQAKAGKKQKKS